MRRPAPSPRLSQVYSLVTGVYAFSILLTSSAGCQRITKKGSDGRTNFYFFIPYQNKMHSYYLNVSKPLDQEMGHEPQFSLESNFAPFPRSVLFFI